MRLQPEALQEQAQQLLRYQEEISEWAEKHETLKTVNSMLGSDDNKRETKLKINSLNKNRIYVYIHKFYIKKYY